jgi:small subunit ribosomal protein S6
MNKYELALVVTAKIEDDARAAVVEKAKGYITRAEGVITNVEDWGKKRLAYEINYEREGYYYFIHFEAESTAPAHIENDVRIMDNVLRYLIVRQDEDFVAPETPAEETVQEEPVPAEAAETAEEAPAAQEVQE